jgi:cAMP-dependent protein kinase regulator
MSANARTAAGMPPPNYQPHRRGSVSAESYNPKKTALAANEGCPSCSPCPTRSSCSACPLTISAPNPNPSADASASANPQPNALQLDPERRARIETALAGNLLFRNLDAEQKALIFAGMSERTVSHADTAVIRQGEPGDNFYLVEAGRFGVEVDGRPVVEIGPGGSFGELALMYNTPRAATVRSLTPGRLLAVDRATFRKVIIDVSYRKRQQHMAFLRAMPLLATLSDAEIGRIADALEPCDFAPGCDVVCQGDPGAAFFILVHGSAQVLRDGESVGSLGPGDFFGELALLNRSPRAATVRATTALSCLSLNEADFVRLLGPLRDMLKRSQDHYAKYQPLMD